VNTRLLEPDEAAAYRGMSGGVYPGLGAVLTIRRHAKADSTTERNVTVVDPMPGSPAEQAGLLPGDRITEVDGHWIAPTRLSPRVLNRLTEDVGPLFTPVPGGHAVPRDEEEDQPKRNADEERTKRDAADAERRKWRTSTDVDSALRALTVGTSGKHTLTFERPGETKPRTVEVTLGRTEVPAVTSRALADGVGYVRLHQIAPATVQQFATALADLQQHGARSLILDLRRSPGGTIAQVQEIASRLMPSGTVAILQRRDSSRKLVKQPLTVKSVEKRARFRSIAVLVDGGTAGAAEALAAALHDAGLAKLVGAQTFGDGTEQTLFPLDNGAALSITTAKMFSPKEVDYDGKGLKPDVVVAAEAGNDRPLEQALRTVRSS
jgi:carboxyl-terminal processing protease